MSETSNLPSRLPDGWIYFVRGGPFFKIGWSKNPARFSSVPRARVA